MRRYLTPLLALIPLLTPLHAGAQDSAVSISADVVSRRLAIGETGTMVITAIGGEPENLPTQLQADGLIIDYNGNQFSAEIINGKSSAKFSYFYKIRGESEGAFTIPAVKTKIRGTDVQSDPIEITIFKRSPGDSEDIDATRPYFARLRLDVEEIYQNQIVPFDVVAYVQGRNAIADVVGAELKHENFVIKNFRKLTQDATELGGNLYSMARLPSNLFALREGEHTIGPAQVAVRIVDSRSGFGFPGIFQRTNTVRLSTNSLTIKVKPLPAGAPPSFTGGVGQFTMTMSVSDKDVSVGDPVSVEFEVKGAGNLGTMSAPVFTSTDRGTWKTYDPAKEITEGDESDGETVGRATFSQVIIPLQKTDTIPPFELGYFDPESGKYEVIKTEPVAITVNDDTSGGANLPSLSGEPRSGSDSSPAQFSADRPQAQFTDILHIRTTTPNWRGIAAIEGRPGVIFFLIQVLLSIAFCTLAGFGLSRYIKRKMHERATAHISPTFKQAVREVPKRGAKRRDFYQAVDRALHIWKSEHNDAPDKLLSLIDRLSVRCESYLYSGVQRPDEPIPESEIQEFDEILRKLARN